MSHQSLLRKSRIVLTLALCVCAAMATVPLAGRFQDRQPELKATADETARLDQTSRRLQINLSEFRGASAPVDRSPAERVHQSGSAASAVPAASLTATTPVPDESPIPAKAFGPPVIQAAGSAAATPECRVIDAAPVHETPKLRDEPPQALPAHIAVPSFIYSPVTVNVDNGSLVSELRRIENRMEQFVEQANRLTLVPEPMARQETPATPSRLAQANDHSVSDSTPQRPELPQEPPAPADEPTEMPAGDLATEPVFDPLPLAAEQEPQDAVHPEFNPMQAADEPTAIPQSEIFDPRNTEVPFAMSPQLAPDDAVSADEPTDSEAVRGTEETARPEKQMPNESLSSPETPEFSPVFEEPQDREPDHELFSAPGDQRNPGDPRDSDPQSLLSPMPAQEPVVAPETSAAISAPSVAPETEESSSTSSGMVPDSLTGPINPEFPPNAVDEPLETAESAGETLSETRNFSPEPVVVEFATNADSHDQLAATPPPVSFEHQYRFSGEVVEPVDADVSVANDSARPSTNEASTSNSGLDLTDSDPAVSGEAEFEWEAPPVVDIPMELSSRAPVNEPESEAHRAQPPVGRLVHVPTPAESLPVPLPAEWPPVVPMTDLQSLGTASPRTSFPRSGAVARSASGSDNRGGVRNPVPLREQKPAAASEQLRQRKQAMSHTGKPAHHGSAPPANPQSAARDRHLRDSRLPPGETSETSHFLHRVSSSLRYAVRPRTVD